MKKQPNLTVRSGVCAGVSTWSLGMTQGGKFVQGYVSPCTKQGCRPWQAFTGYWSGIDPWRHSARLAESMVLPAPPPM